LLGEHISTSGPIIIAAPLQKLKLSQNKMLVARHCARYIRRMRQGFTLVELSIVLVILGLLVGGVLSGQSLIRSSQIRTVSAEYQTYAGSVKAFLDKYQQLPGDMNNAALFWTTTVNGNGNAQIEPATGVSVTGEMFQFWNQLALAGLIEGSYSGIAGPTVTGFDSVLGTNVPRSKLSSGGWGTVYIGIAAGTTRVYAADYGNLLMFGGRTSGATPTSAVLRPEDAWNIDTKIDDGKPGTGKIMMISSLNWGTAGACSLATGNTDYVSGYNLASDTISCGLYFPKAY
jgi:prepilin-type N-terminal cleavage/methylation domain-containing protein